MKLVVDVMGFENEVKEAIKACNKFVKKNKDVSIILVGDKKEIDKHNKKNFDIINTTQFISMSDSPILALRNKETSMYKAFELVNENEADGVLSAGNTNCFISLAFHILKLINGINKAAFMPFLPTVDGQGFMMLDVGANKEVTGEDLYQFAKMANIYCRDTKKINMPRIGLINIGTEDTKGFNFHKEAKKLLNEDATLNFKGYVEPKELIYGGYDIAVCDGYAGNLILKSYEGALKSVAKIFKKSLKNPITIIGLLIAMSPIKKIIKTFDYKNNAGAFVMGLNKPAVKTHGSADKKQFYSSLKMLYSVVKNNVCEQIKKEAIGK